MQHFECAKQTGKNAFETAKKTGKCAFDTAKHSLARSNQWLTSPAKPPTGLARALTKTFAPLIGAPTTRLEFVIAPKTLYATLWLIVMAGLGRCVVRVGRVGGGRGKRDAVLLVIVLSALLYHLTWALYHWQDTLLKPVMPYLARFV